MSFGAQKATYDKLLNALNGQQFTITVVKNAAGYNDWTAITDLDKTAAATPASASSVNNVTASPAGRSNFETPEERARKQIYIVRQSSISSAISTLTSGAKHPPKIAEVLEVAKVYEQYVFGNSTETPTFDEVISKGGDDLDDVPM